MDNERCFSLFMVMWMSTASAADTVSSFSIFSILMLRISVIKFSIDIKSPFIFGFGLIPFYERRLFVTMIAANHSMFIVITTCCVIEIHNLFIAFL